MLARYVLRRLVGMVIVVFLVLTIAFIIVRLAPGDPAALMLGPEATTQDAADPRAGAQRGNGRVHVGEGGHQDDVGGIAGCAQCLEPLHAAGAGQRHVQQDQVHMALLQQRSARFGAVGRQHAADLAFQRP